MFDARSIAAWVPLALLGAAKASTVHAITYSTLVTGWHTRMRHVVVASGQKEPRLVGVWGVGAVGGRCSWQLVQSFVDLCGGVVAGFSIHQADAGQDPDFTLCRK
jgi:hypothetical protein